LLKRFSVYLNKAYICLGLLSFSEWMLRSVKGNLRLAVKGGYRAIIVVEVCEFFRHGYSRYVCHLPVWRLNHLAPGFTFSWSDEMNSKYQVHENLSLMERNAVSNDPSKRR
jgi:hypothetical protein